MNAKFIQDLLNTTDLVFRITDERILVDTYIPSNDVVGTFEAVTGTYLFDEIGNKVFTYQVSFIGKNANFAAFKAIVEALPNGVGFSNESKDFFFYTQPLIFDEFIKKGGEKQFTARLVFQIVEVVGGVSGKSTTIKINNEPIDFKGVLYRQDKSLLAHTAFGKNREVNLVSELLTLVLPVNATTSFLLVSGLDNTYNESFLLEWQIGGITKTFDAVLRVNVIEYNANHEPIVFKATFERALPREIWQMAIFQKENYWAISKENKNYNKKIDIDFDNESDFLDYLMEEESAKLALPGYVVAGGTLSSPRWRILDGSPSEYNDLYEFYDDNAPGQEVFELFSEEQVFELAEKMFGKFWKEGRIFRFSNITDKNMFVYYGSDDEVPAPSPSVGIGSFSGATQEEFMFWLNANYDANDYTKETYVETQGTGKTFWAYIGNEIVYWYIVARGDWEILTGSPSQDGDLYSYDYAEFNEDYEEIMTPQEVIDFVDNAYAEMWEEDIVVRVENMTGKSTFTYFSNGDDEDFVAPDDYDDLGSFPGETIEDFMTWLNANYDANDYEKFSFVSAKNNDMIQFFAIIDNEAVYWFVKSKQWELNFLYGTVTAGGQYAAFQSLPVIDYTHKASVELTTSMKNDKIVGKAISYSNGFSVLFLLNSITQTFVDDLYEQSKSKYKLKFKIGLKEYEYEDLVIQEIERQNGENANQVLQISFVEGE